jgi:hypothetical protein
MKIWVENYVNARAFKPVEPTLAIRVFDRWAIKHPKNEDGSWSNGPAAPFPKDRYKHVWEYTFEDVNYDLYPDEERIELMAKHDARPFTANIADDIVRKFNRHKDDVSSMLVHCHAGLSRSVAIATALDEMFELGAQWVGDSARFKKTADYVGNEFVYRLVCEAAERIL